nr:putative reverse transcriptase domain-containing protein [Tanacetum cinerariifolium]
MDKDESVPIILGCPFLAMARTVIDIHDGRMSLRVSKETVTFNIKKSIRGKEPYNDYLYCADQTIKFVHDQQKDTVHLDGKWVETNQNNEKPQAVSFHPRHELVVLADATERVRDAIGFQCCLASSSGWTKRTDWESSLTRLELVQETTDKVALVKEKPKARDRQKRYVVYELVEIMDREIKKLRHKKIALVKVRWNSKCGPEFTWEHEYHMRIKYPQLFVDRVVKPAS